MLTLLGQRREVGDLVLPLLLTLDVALGPGLAFLALLSQRVGHPLSSRRLYVVVVNLDEADLFARPLLAKTGLADQPLKSVGVGKKVVARTGRWHRRRRWIGRDRRPEGVGVCVDAVVVFDEETPFEIISAIQPDVLVKGADWAADRIVGRDVVEARGGRVVRMPMEDGWSTTTIIERAKSVTYM